ncbi:acetyl-CoA carboxylase biotin carboxyl carrier protein subunit [Enterococcus lactis]|uniref:acetyl-CoA carboxylase biotin carboxyl carrier protein subunit n=1 Tax=Enterococcus lactis TaxID=357441 RepID=UPI001CA39C0E|nr:acetyl-CoA carboxylase biotin carboxyl carrier protein subunit [Enterococcus lactis]QZY26306.1 acetyl-CoA carboxylase biotin carboxyl carrier protein subunit [Enterococcus lactis]
MLRKFKLTIDGKEYLVEMEEIGGTPQQLSMPSQSVVQKPISQEEETPLKRETAPLTPIAQGTDDAITAPMPGTILRILVDNGKAVQENQPLMILEAMKMENEIVAGKAGTVAAIHVTAGDMVNPGDALITVS